MWYAILVLTIVDVCVEAQITLTPCVADTVNGNSVSVAEVRRGQTSQFTCRGFAAGDIVLWRYRPDGGTESSAGSCIPAGCAAGQLGPGFSKPTRPSASESVVTVDPREGGTVTEDYVKTGSLGCRRGTVVDVTNFCRMDLIDPAVGTCSVKFERLNTDDWVATGSCTITAYSSRGRYRCHWYRARDSSQEEFQYTVFYTGPSGVCRFNQALPAAGRYSYRVGIMPGGVEIQATFIGSNEISTPTAPTVSGCSSDSYIEENSAVSCTCSTTGLGQPAGRLVWRRVGAASPVSSGDYGNSWLEVSQMLTRTDHEVTQFRCDVDWARDATGSPLTFKVGYKPEGLTFKLNSQSEVTVAENAIVTMTCEANSRPVATMTVHKDGVTSPVSSGPSPLTLTLDPARCADTGTYVCSGSNQFGQPDSPVSGKVYVTCAPRSTSTNLPALNYLNASISVTFEVTAYPPPLAPFTFTGPGIADSPSSLSDISLYATCRPKAAGVQHLFTCSVTVLEMRSGKAAGAYIVNIANSAGYQLYRFNVTYNGVAVVKPVGQGSGGSGGAVTVALAVGMAVMGVALIASSALIVWLCRRQRMNKGTGVHNVELQDVGGGNDNNDQHLYNEILDDPPPAADPPGEHRHRTDRPLPAVPKPAPRPIEIENSLSGQRRPGVAPPITILDQSAILYPAAGSHCIAPTATGGTEISSNDRSGTSDYLIPVPVIPATHQKKSPDDLSDRSTYLTPVAPSFLRKPPPNEQSDGSEYVEARCPTFPEENITQ